MVSIVSITNNDELYTTVIDLLGNQTRWDENDNRVDEYFDMVGRVVKRVVYNNQETLETNHYFDGLSNEVITIDPKGSMTVKRYNQLNQLSEVQLPIENVWENDRLLLNITPYKINQFDLNNDTIISREELTDEYLEYLDVWINDVGRNFIWITSIFFSAIGSTILVIGKKILMVIAKKIKN